MENQTQYGFLNKEVAYSGFQMTTVQKHKKNVEAIHELPLHFLCCTQLKTAIAISLLCFKSLFLNSS